MWACTTGILFLLSGRFNPKELRIKLITKGNLWARCQPPTSQLSQRWSPQLWVEKRGRGELANTGLQTNSAPQKAQSASTPPLSRSLWKTTSFKIIVQVVSPPLKVYPGLYVSSQVCWDHSSAGLQRGSLCTAGLGVRALPSAGEGGELLGTRQDFSLCTPQLLFSNI